MKCVSESKVRTVCPNMFQITSAMLKNSKKFSSEASNSFYRYIGTYVFFFEKVAIQLFFAVCWKDLITYLVNDKCRKKSSKVGTTSL